jgi:hypothetical protein
MTIEQEYEVNKLLAREFIQAHLAIEPSEENVAAFANLIQQLEQQENTQEPLAA